MSWVQCLLLLGPLRVFCAANEACGAQADNRAMAKMDLELWMQEDGTNMFGAVLYSADIYDRGTAERTAAHILVRPPSLLLPSCVSLMLRCKACFGKGTQGSLHVVSGVLSVLNEQIALFQPLHKGQGFRSWAVVSCRAMSGFS